MISVLVRRLREGVPLPTAATPGAAGYDLCAAEGCTLAPGARAAVPTGLQIALPPGYEAQVRPRSGLALKHGITVLNAPGTIDADYRGELKVILINLGEFMVQLNPGDRIAQLVVAPVASVTWTPTEILPEKAAAASAAPAFDSWAGFGATQRWVLVSGVLRLVSSLARSFRFKTVFLGAPGTVPGSKDWRDHLPIHRFVSLAPGTKFRV